MHAWGFTNWLITYDYGFTKRGLWGTLAAPLIHSKIADLTPFEIIELSSYPIYITTILSIFIFFNEIKKNTTDHSFALMLGLLFAGSPYIKLTANTLGYMDQIILILSVLSIALTLNGRRIIPAVVLSIAILIHEAALLTGYPVFLLTLIVIHHYSQSTFKNKASLIRDFIAASLPLATFITLLAITTLNPIPDYNSRLLTIFKNIPSIPQHTTQLFADFITTSFFEYLKDEFPKLPQRLTDDEYRWTYALFASIVALINYYASDKNKFITLISIIAGTGAWGLHAIAIDTARIWPMALPYMFMTIWVITKTRTTDFQIPPIAPTLVLALFCLESVMPVSVMAPESITTTTDDNIKNLFFPIILMCWLTTKTSFNHHVKTTKIPEKKYE